MRAPHGPVSAKFACVTQMPLLGPPTERNTAAASDRFWAVLSDSILKNSTVTLPDVIGRLRSSMSPMANRLRPCAASLLACTAVSGAPLARGLTSGLAGVGATVGGAAGA